MRRVLLGLVLAVALAPFVAQPAASATASGVIVDGHARFEVLAPTLVRLEYAADGAFEDATTFNVVNRDFAVPQYTTGVVDGWREIHTDAMTVRYQEGSGPFTPENTAVSVLIDGTWQTGHPSWPAAPGACAFGTACQAEEGQLTGGESVNYDHTGFTGRGFTADYGQVSAADTWALTGVPSDGTYPLQLRYANGGSVTRTLSVRVGTDVVGQVGLPPTGSWDSWSVASFDVPLTAGANTVGVRCASGDGCNANLDSVAVTAPGDSYPTAGPPPPVTEPGQLGGWTRGLDAYTNQAGADIGDVELHPGILNRRGWSLLDDTYTALRTGSGWPHPRPSHDGAYQDGYLFGYGHDYQQALRDLRALTGPADMLPEWAFGVWFSRYFAYSTSDYENQLIPAFRSHGVPLDALVVDTDWKSPQTWDGWNWNANLFPDPQAFLDWARQQGLNVALNVHAGIDGSDPKFPAAQQTAQGQLQHAAQCFSPQCYRFDWSDPAQAKAWFDLHQPFEQQGVRQWWLDWCCTDSVVDMPGLTPDSWINELYARNLDARGLRGFVLARLGASFEDYRGAPASGPWGEHRSTVHFTGDTEATWQTLAFEAQMSTAEASIGQPYVSHDIGSFKGKHLPDDLYDRWVQFATFQPILRLHSDHGDRLPWDYGAAQDPATKFLRLREALVPYTYTLAAEATQTGLPIARPLYLDYPDQPAAYDNGTEYLYGPDVLVAPVTTPGAIAQQHVWFPPGRWTDYFTGATFTGPASATINEPLDRMPVFVRAGGIVPEQPTMEHVGAAPVDPLTLNVYAGGSGAFSMYEDAGEGTGYRNGQSARTPFRYDESESSSAVTIGARTGSYPGASSGRAYRVQLVDVSAPHGVTLDGNPLPKVAPGSASAGWWYDAGNATLHVTTSRVSATRSATVTQFGGQPVARSESAAVALTLDPPTPTTLSPGSSTTVATTVSNGGPGAITGVQTSLSGPSGWKVTPTDSIDAGRVPVGGAVTTHWTVSAPASQSGPVTAALKGTARYVSNGSPAEVTTYQGPPPLIAPHIDSVQPDHGAAGDVVTINGQNFGATQGSSYLFFVDGDTSWGAPFDGATFVVNSWSDTKITFTIPTPSGPGGIWHVTPGDTATVNVNTAGGTSNTVPIAITG
ncbi:MAG TPA: TIM-barrel domain-containing protein [Jatrophihabitans sp.]|nr:TIM-barrel domain-containing protein [Jatrophihabitans sp.]